MKKYYSTELKKVFDTEDELEEAEQKYLVEKEEEAKALSLKKEEAKAVEDAYKNLVGTKKKAFKEIDEAEQVYISKRNEFVKKYGSFHMTYTDKDAQPLSNLEDIFTDKFGTFENFMNIYSNIFNMFK
jgi:hypothetical protein